MVDETLRKKNTTRKMFELEKSLNFVNLTTNGFPMYDIVYENTKTDDSIKATPISKSKKNIKVKLNINNQDIFDFLEVEPELQLSLLANINEKTKKTEFIINHVFKKSSVSKSVEMILKFEYLIFNLKSKNNSTDNYRDLNQQNKTNLYTVNGANYGFLIVVFLNNANLQNLSEHEIITNFKEIESKLSNQDFSIENFTKFENLTIKFTIFPFNPIRNSNNLQEYNLKQFFKAIKNLIDRDFKNNELYPYEIRLVTMTNTNSLNQADWANLASYFKSILTEMNQKIFLYFDTNRFDKFLNINEKDFKNSIKEKLQQLIRKFEVVSKTEVIKLKQFPTQDSKNYYLSIGKIYDEFQSTLNEKKCKSLINKMKDIDSYENFKVEYMSKELDGRKLRQFIREKSIFLCYGQKLKKNHADIWEQCFQQFITILTRNEYKFYNIVNFDVCKPVDIDCKKLDILKFENGKFSSILIISECDLIPKSICQPTSPKIEPKKQINILLLGESGVGKSTFINALHKYTKFATLEQAEQSSSNDNLIGSYFHYSDKIANKMVKIKTSGDHNNENLATGQSCTQKAKSYSIKLDDECELNIIDTPGMGDTRGVVQDQKNFKETIQYVSTFDHLNAICFLVKTNNARLTPGFRYCFKELFSYLNKQTIDNLIFCFTNTRETMFSPGDSYEGLETFIKEIESNSDVKIALDIDKNIFCFENDSLRFLELVKNKIKFNFDLTSYQNSWQISSENTQNLIKYVKSLKPFGADQIINISELTQKFNHDLSQALVDEILKVIEKEKDFLKTITQDENVANYFPNLIKEIFSKFELLNLHASFSKMLEIQSNSTIFNDNFEARMEELIKHKQMSSNDSSSWKTIEVELLKIVIETYKNIKKEPNTPEYRLKKLENIAENRKNISLQQKMTQNEAQK